MRRLLAATTIFIVLIAVPSFSQMKGSSGAAVKAPALTPMTGVVKDTKGKPVSKARVDCSIFLIDGGKLSEKTTIYTDKNGRFVFKPTSKLDRVIYGFFASAPGFCGGRGYYSVNKPAEVKITLWPTHTVTGRVVDENGAPVAGATVKVNYWQAFRDDGRTAAECYSTDDHPLKAITEKDGRFDLKGVVNPSDFEFVYAELSITKKGRATIKERIDKESMKGEIRLVQPLECILEGTLYLPGRTGTAPEGTRVAVRIFNKNLSEERETPVGKDGRFRFVELPPGRAYVMLASQSREYTPNKGIKIPKPRAWALPTVVDLELTPNQPKVIDMELVQGALIKGSVVDKASGKPFGKAMLRLEHAGRPKSVTPDYAYTDDKGEFSARVAPGNVNVIVERVDNTYFEDDDSPSVSFKVANGDEKSDVVIKVDPLQSRSIYNATRRATPDDFEIRSGTYRLAWDPELMCSDAVRFTLELSSEQVARKLKGAPRWKSDKPDFMAYRFDGPGDEGLLVLAEDESGGSGKGYDTVYVDRNRNWNLSDDEPIRLEPILTECQQVYTEWTDVLSRYGPIKIRLAIYSPDGSERYATLERTGGWKGTIETNKGTVECALVDSNANGAYGDVWKWHEDGQPDVWGDYVYIDSNCFGRLVLTGWSPHRVRLDPICRVGNRFYRFHVDATDDTESKITIEPYMGPMGSLIVRVENVGGLEGVPEQIYVSGRNGSFGIKNVSEQPVTLPVGGYRLMGCDLVLKSKSSQKLRLGCRLNSALDLKPDETTVVAISGELSLAINPDMKEMVWKPGTSEKLEWMMKIGENSIIYSFGGNDPRFSPKVKFFNRNGELLYTTTAGYT